MHAIFTEKKIFYDGSQLRSGFIKETTGIDGDAILSWVGGCDVAPEFMVDMADLEAGNKIYSPLMLHFIFEHSGTDLDRAILRQRLFASIVRDYLAGKTGKEIVREGDDLYIGERKITISVATVSPHSSLIHFAINIKTAGVPVPAAGLEELGLGVDVTARDLMKMYVDELVSINYARTCAKPVD